MIAFLFAYLAIYGGANFYVFWKFRSAWPQAGAWLGLPAVFLALMVAAPMAAVMLQRGGPFRVGRVVAFVGYPWMALAMWLFFLLLAGDLWNLGAKLVGMLAPVAAGLALPPARAFVAAATVTAALGAWSAWEAWNVRINTVVVRSARPLAGSAPLRIVQISDLHLGLTNGPRWLRRTARLVEEARPDVIVCTGDLADGADEYGPALTEPLAALRAPLGKFAVFGNHEYYTGPERSKRFLADCAFRLLRGESARLSNGALLVGVDDPAGRRMGQPPVPGEDELLPARGAREFTVLLKHRPNTPDASLGRFDLQLSGHTHGGQIFPFGLFAKLDPGNQMVKGLHRLAEGSIVYVSPGTGTWGPPMRLGAPPEVTLIIIEPAGAN